MPKPEYFNATLDYRRPDSTRISGYLTGGDTLKDAVKALEWAIHYYTQDPELVNDHIVIVNAHIDLCCGNCGGSGIVRKGKRLYATKTCPVCNGKATTRVETWVENEQKVVA